MAGWGLAVDFGTSNTAAVLHREDASAEPVLIDGSPLLASAVFAQPDGGLLTGRDAVLSARLAPERFEPNPKLRVDDGVVLLGAEVPVARLFGAVLGRVADEARRVAGEPLGQVVLTHPVGWGPRRQAVLVDAAERAGLGAVDLVAEPVAAARYFRQRHDSDIGARPVVVYDFGGGTFDVSVVSDTRVLAYDGLADAGGLDVDTALIASLEATYRARDPAAWVRLRHPSTPDERRAWRQFADDVRGVKEMLSRTAQAFVHIPLVDVEAPIGREQVEAIATPLIARTVTATKALIAAAGLALPLPGPLLLVGGATRMPLVATMLLRHLKTAPVVAEQPELIVAQGALLEAAPDPTSTPRSPAPTPAFTSAPGTAATTTTTITADTRAAGRGETKANPSPSATEAVVTVDWQESGTIALAGHTDTIMDVAFSPDSRVMASCGLDKTVRLWDVTSGAPTSTWPSANSVVAVAFSPDGRVVASMGGPPWVVRLWEVATGEVTAVLPLPGAGGSSVYDGSIAFSPDGTTLACTRNSTLSVWEVASSRLTAALTDGRATSKIYCLAFSPVDGRTLATTAVWSIQGGVFARLTATTKRVVAVHLWDLDARSIVNTIIQDEAGSFLGVGFGSVAFSPDGEIVAGRQDTSATLWDVASGHEIVRVATRDIRSSTHASVVSGPDGTTVAWAEYRGIPLWDIAGSRRDAIEPMGPSPDGRILATCGDDEYQSIRLWRT